MKELFKNVCMVIGMLWVSFFIGGLLSMLIPMTASLGVLIAICTFCIIVMITFSGKK